MRITWKIWLLIIVLILALLAVSPWGFFSKGAAIKSVERNSTLFNEGLRQGMVITEINYQKVLSTSDYTKIISDLLPSQTEKKLIFSTDKGEFIVFTNQTPEMVVGDLPKSKIKLGLDLSGGARALVKPEVALNQSGINDLIAITSNRLNVFGISDISVRQVSDLSGNNFMMIEVAGAAPADLKSLVEKQGKFEAKIGNETVFAGGEEDIKYVARTGQEAGIESCFAVEGGYACRFRFAVYLSEQAAQRHANITADLQVNSSNNYLEKTLDLYVDDKLTDSLLISEELRGKVTTQVSVQGSGSGTTQADAFKSAQENMRQLQTILITGSIPFKLEIVKLDTISPVLGKEFTKNLFILALVVFAIVSVILFVRYRKIKITLSVIMTMFSEAFITLGIAALISWNLDAPSIAGIIAGMGTGVNDQIVIIDEAVTNTNESLLERIKRAFFIIVGAFLTIVAAMLPLFGAGAGMLRGFALTTIIGVSVGILITRPAFADILKIIQK
jgi:preprotein translocase subunit SecD